MALFILFSTEKRFIFCSTEFVGFTYIYAPLAYKTHLTDSCPFSKFVCIELKVFADFQVRVVRGFFHGDRDFFDV